MLRTCNTVTLSSVLALGIMSIPANQSLADVTSVQRTFPTTTAQFRLLLASIESDPVGILPKRIEIEVNPQSLYVLVPKRGDV